ncbi:hypothetical protein CTheo_6190 [Ceratobasidium theobromae]|uniref:Uncharacterized protein n=1 Tax=Ceratobasidium theobromae TaxID=1582974 RepID=A0A5N5QFF8_9AGAM|nr:hypothetical protein CTheo_6190 [Ceratobasidium theobromae]
MTSIRLLQPDKIHVHNQHTLDSQSHTSLKAEFSKIVRVGVVRFPIQDFVAAISRASHAPVGSRTITDGTHPIIRQAAVLMTFPSPNGKTFGIGDVGSRVGADGGTTFGAGELDIFRRSGIMVIKTEGEQSIFEPD